MDVQRLIGFLERQREKIDEPGFDLGLWRGSTVNVMRKALGPGSELVERLDRFRKVETLSVDELYPRKIYDEKATKERLEALMRDLLDELRFLDPEELGRENAHYGRDTLKRMAQGLREHLAGSQTNRLREIVRDGGPELEENLLDALKQFDVDRIQRILAHVLAGDEVWRELDG